MNPIARVFLGWESPLVETVAGFLLDGRPGRPLDLSDTLVVTPTRQAGRGLRQELARRAAERETAVVGARVVTPSFFLAPDPEGPPVASPILETAAWVETLRDAPADLMTPVFPSGKRRESLWARQAAETLRALRAELCDGGETLQSIAAKHADTLEERDRWLALAGLEARYLERLARAGLRDACAAKIAGAAAPRLDAEIRRLVIAGVTDPSLLALSSLRGLAARLETRILIQAPEQLAGDFDEWGRPLPAAWKERRIEIPGGHERIRVAQDPEGESREVVRMITGAAEGFTASDLAVAVADNALAPALQQALGEQGLSFTDPAKRPLIGHPAGRMTLSFLSCLGEAAFSEVAEWLRQEDLLEALRQSPGIESTALLRELDEFRLRHLPGTLADALEHFDGPAYRPREGKFTALGPALRELERLLHPPAPAPGGIAGAALAVLKHLYRHRRLGQREMADRDFRSAAAQILEVLNEAAGLEAAGFALDGETLAALLRDALQAATYSADRPARDHSLYGWLELAWLPERLLIVTGMREGAVPDTQVRDPFLPDTLRRRLGLRCDETRLARDAHLLTALAGQRSANGFLGLTFSRTNARGDSHKPSRLLFRVPPEQLAARARRIFLDPPAPPPPTPAATLGFTLDFTRTPASSRAPAAPPVLSVSKINAYLRCPFRYYLAEIGGLRPVDLDKDAPDDLDFGSLVHHALEKLGRDPDLRTCADEERVAAFLADRAREEVRAVYGTRPPFAALMSGEAAETRLRAAARLHATSLRDGWEIVAVEREFELVEGPLRLRGRMDRVERHRATGRLRVIDFKTRDNPEEPAKAAFERMDPPDWRAAPDGSSRWKDLQLPLYALALMRSPEASPAGVEAGYADLPATLSGARFVPWPCEGGEPGPSAAERESALRCAVEAARRIQAGIFGPPATGVKYDDLAEELGFPLEDLFGLRGVSWPAPEGPS